MAIDDGKVDGADLTWKLDILVPMPMTLYFQATVTGDTMSGTATAEEFGSGTLAETRA